MDESGGFCDRVVVVTGAASGIGAALTARLLAAGAAVTSLDVAPVEAAVAGSVLCDLGDPRSIDGAVGDMPGQIDMLFNCAGVPNGGRFSPGEVMAINWLGLRHLTESLLDRIPRGGSVTHVASTAGRGWAGHRVQLAELMEAHTFEAGAAWVRDHGDRDADDVVGDGYALSKEAVQWYTMWRALQVLPGMGVRMNSVCPGVTDTQLAADFRRGVGDEILDRAVAIAGRIALPDEMAPALMFLADEASASYINGVNLNVDRGTGAAHSVGSR